MKESIVVNELVLYKIIIYFYVSELRKYGVEDICRRILVYGSGSGRLG